MRVDGDLIQAAAQGSPDPVASSVRDVERWVAALPETEKTEIVLRLVKEGAANLREEMLRRFREAMSAGSSSAPTRARSVGELLGAAEKIAEERRRKAAAREARARARREREATQARERHLNALARREAEAWKEVAALIATKQPKRYDEAVALLVDLRDVCARAGRQADADRKIAQLRREHAKKPSLLERFVRAGLW